MSSIDDDNSLNNNNNISNDDDDDDNDDSHSSDSDYSNNQHDNDSSSFKESNDNPSSSNENIHHNNKHSHSHHNHNHNHNNGSSGSPPKSKTQQLAAKIRKENETFLKSLEQSRVERLKFLLKQTEIFAHFLVNNKHEPHPSTSATSSHPKSKRTKNKKASTIPNFLPQNIDEEDLDLYNSSQQLTRLYYQPSILTGGKLTEYQLDGVNWLISLYEKGLNGILADEMGLGKTIQSIAFMSFLKLYKKKNGYFLVIVPKSTMPNWSRECKLWCPSLNVIVLNPVKEEREETLKKISKHKFEVVITSYEGVNICINKLKKIKWELLIIDEAHRIKNENALLSRNVRNLESKFRILVTGTPLQNNLHELWALLNFLLPDIFTSSEDFDEWFGMNKDNEEIKTEEQQEERNAEIVQQLHKILKPFLLRRTKSEVEKTLPPKKEIHIKVGLTEIQKNIYKKLLTSSLLNESKTIYKNIIMQLRKACNHPYLFDGVEEENPIPNHLVMTSSKMRILDKLCTKLQGKSQILIFSQMTRMLDILEDYCVEKQYKLCRIDGDTSLEERETQIAEFTKQNSDVFIFLLSTRAGGLGLNLMTSDTVILFDSDWNPQVDLQAMDRVHRIGQSKPVLIYRFICENTIEEKIIERQAMRLKLDSLIIQQGRVLKVGETFTKDQMKEMIQYGADAIFRAGDDFKDEDIDIILERGEQQTNHFFAEAEKQAKSKSNLLINMSFNSSELYKFENEDYSKKRKEDSERALSLAFAEELENENKLSTRRERGKVNYNIDHDTLLNPKLQKKKNKTAKIPIYHLYKNRERLIELKQKQINYYQDNNIKVPDKIDEDFGIEDGLTQDELAEMKSIYETGFLQWDKKEYEIFLSYIEEYGKSNTAICKLNEVLSTKTEKEIKEYYDAFWERINDLPDGMKIIRNMERKEKLEKQKELSVKLLKHKCDVSGGEFEDIKILYPNNNRQSEYSYEEDQFLIYVTNKCGYGNWEEIIREIRVNEELMFNYFLKSRNKGEIQKRVDYLVKVLEKEFANLDLNDNNNNNNNGVNNNISAITANVNNKEIIDNVNNNNKEQHNMEIDN